MHPFAICLFACLYVCLAVPGLTTALDIAEEDIVNLKDKTKYKDCDDVMVSGLYKDAGSYNVYLNHSTPTPVYCRFEDGVAYSAIMQQKYGRENFKRPYQQYMYGFGSAASGDFWLGLHSMKSLSDSGASVLTVTLQDWNHVIKTIRYTHFRLGSWSNGFPLSIGGYASSHILPDDFSHNNGMPFATYDKPDRNNCAVQQMAGWWYNYCTFTLPTGHYYLGGPYTPSGKFYDGIYYSDWHGYGYSLKYIKMELSKY